MTRSPTWAEDYDRPVAEIEEALRAHPAAFVARITAASDVALLLEE